MIFSDRTPEELRFALMLLSMNVSIKPPHRRLLSSAQVILCWRNAPPGLFIDSVQIRIQGQTNLERFAMLVEKYREVMLTRYAEEAEDILNGNIVGRGRPETIARDRYYRGVFYKSIDGSLELVRADQAIIRRSKVIRDSSTLGSLNSPVMLNRERPADYTNYAIYFGTDRMLESQRSVRFGGFRTAGKVSYGVAKVSVPHSHKEGKMERPFLSDTFKGNPDKHIVIHDKELLTLDNWTESARDYLSESFSRETGRNEGLLFIHGYNVSFDSALWRSTQLCHDLKFPGLMLCFSWASLGSTRSYTADEATIDWSASNLRDYLTNVTQNLGLSGLHIIAHSMGNRALLSVLENWENKPGATPISQIILAAPDVDSSRFVQFGRVFNLYEQVTLYASKHDRALAVSAFIHNYPRAGDATPPLVMEHLSTIDVSAAGKDMFGLGHTYVAEASKVFRDLFYIVRHRHTPDQRAGIKKRDEGHWELS